MNDKKVVIIGGGLAGLSAGIELQLRGVNTEIYEKAPWLGGVCTSWVRKGYRFDGCIHWMVGTNPKAPMFKLYEHVKALEPTTISFHPEEIFLEYLGEQYAIPLELEAFTKFLLSVSPEDERAINELNSAIAIFISGDMPYGRPKGLWGLLTFPFKYRQFFKLYRKYGKKDVGYFTKNLHSETLKVIIHYLMPEHISVFALVMMLGMRFTKNGGYPEGGSLEMINRMENYYKELGGKAYVNSEVNEIVREGSHITAIKVGDKTVEANAVISAGDVHNLLHDLLKEPNLHPELNDLLQHQEWLFGPISLVSFGLKKQLGIPYSISFDLKKSISLDGNRKIDFLSVRGFDFDKSAAPEGKSSVMVMLEDSLDYWQDLRKNNIEEYKKQKDNLVKKVSEFLETKYPSFIESIEVTDVATPATYVRLNNLYKASFEGFLPLPEMLNKHINRKLAGVDNLVLCGQWVTPGGGIPPAIQSGLEAAGMIMKEIDDMQ